MTKLNNWLLISPCFTDFDQCDTVQIDVNDDVIDVDVNRIPDLIRALHYALKLAGSE
jgi:hypothetical protein